MAEPGTIATIVSAIVSVVDLLTRDDIDPNDLARKLKEILRAIERAKTEIIQAILDVEFRDLAGSVEGIFITLGTYDPVRPDEPRLRNVIDDGATIIGRIQAVLNEFDNDSDQFRRVFHVYLIIVWLRALAMAERERRFRNPEIKDIVPMLRTAEYNTAQALQGLKKISDRRFICRAQRRDGATDTISFGYLFEGIFTGVAEVIDEPIEVGIHHNPSTAIAAANAACEDRKDKEFIALPEYSELEKFRHEVGRIIQTIEA